MSDGSSDCKSNPDCAFPGCGRNSKHNSEFCYEHRPTPGETQLPAAVLPKGLERKRRVKDYVTGLEGWVIGVDAAPGSRAIVVLADVGTPDAYIMGDPTDFKPATGKAFPE